MVIVYRFRIWDASSDEWFISSLKGTAGRIRALGGEIIPGTAEEVSRALLDAEGRYHPPGSESPADSFFSSGRRREEELAPAPGRA